MARILVIDSYDSFVYNIVQYLGELGADPVVVRNDAITVTEAVALQPDGVLLSPGPGRPEDAGIICAAQAKADPQSKIVITVGRLASTPATTTLAPGVTTTVAPAG